MTNNLSKIMLVGLAAFAIMAVLPSAAAAPVASNNAIINGCTETFALSSAGNALWYAFYVYGTSPSPANEVSGAEQYGAYQGSSDSTFLGCI